MAYPLADMTPEEQLEHTVDVCVEELHRSQEQTDRQAEALFRLRMTLMGKEQVVEQLRAEVSRMSVVTETTITKTVPGRERGSGSPGLRSIGSHGSSSRITTSPLSVPGAELTPEAAAASGSGGGAAGAASFAAPSKAQLEALRRQIRTLTDSNAELKDEVDFLRHQALQTADEADRYWASRVTAERGRTEAAEAEAAGRDQQLARLTSENAELRQQLGRASKDMEELQHELGEVSARAREDRQRFVDHQARLESAADGAEADASVEAIMDVNEGQLEELAAQIEALRRSLTDKAKENDELRAENADIRRNAHDAARDAAATIEELKRQLAEARRDAVASADEVRQELATVRRQLEKSREELETTETALAETRDELDRKSKDLRKERAQNRAYNIQINDLTVNVTNLKEEITILIAQAAKDAKDAEDARAKAVEQLEAVQDDAQRKADAAAARVAAAEAIATQAGDRGDGMEEELARLQEELARLQEELDTTETALAETRDELEAVKKGARTARARVATLEADRKTSEEAHAQTVADLNNQLDAVTAAEAEAQQNVQRLTDDLAAERADHSADQQAAKTQQAELETVADELRGDLDEAKSSELQVKEELSDAKDKGRKLQEVGAGACSVYARMTTHTRHTYHSHSWSRRWSSLPARLPT